MIATSGFLAALKCTKFVFGRGSAPCPIGGAYSAPQDPGLRGPTSKGAGKVGNGKGREQWKRKDPLSKVPGSAPGMSCRSCPISYYALPLNHSVGLSQRRIDSFLQRQYY